MSHRPWNPDPVHWTDGDALASPGWYFWDETWANREGPYASETEARAGLKKYFHEVLGA